MIPSLSYVLILLTPPSSLHSPGSSCPLFLHLPSQVRSSVLLSSHQAKSQPGHTESLTTLAFVLVWKWTFLGRRCQPEFMAPHLPWALSHFYGSLESSHLCAQVTTLSFQLCHQGSCSALSVSDLAATSSHQVHCLSNSPSFYEHLHLHSRLHLQSQRHGHLSVLFLLCLYDH